MHFVAVITCLFLPLMSLPIFAYLTFKGIDGFKQRKTEKRSLFYFIISMISGGLGVLIYSLRPFLIQNQDLFAEISLGGSIILIMITLVFYVEYLHILLNRIPIFSKGFYYASGAGFISIIFHPWTIEYISNVGFYPLISNLLLLSLLVQMSCMFFIIYLTFHQNKIRIEKEIAVIENSIKIKLESVGNLSQIERIPEYKNRVKTFRLITVSILIGGLLGVIGLLPTTRELSLPMIGFLFAFIPQAYILSEETELYFYLLTNKIRATTIDLERIFFLLQQSDMSVEGLELELKSLVEFIKKADLELSAKK